MTTADLPTEEAASTLDADELRAWLRLAHAKELRPLALRTLLGTFGGPREVLSEFLRRSRKPPTPAQPKPCSRHPRTSKAFRSTTILKRLWRGHPNRATTS
jgi:hypothetical protein